MDRGSEAAHKVERVRRWMREQGRPATVIRQRNNFSWITAGGRSHVSTARDAGAAAVVVTAERFVLVASNIEARRLADEELVGVPVDVLEFPWHAADGELGALARAIGDGASACNDGMPDVAAAIAALRASLLDPEIRRAERLGRETADLVEGVCRGLAPGTTEDEVAARVHAAAMSVGARVPVCLVAADDRIDTRRHPLPTGRPIRARAMIAVCVERGGLVCSATRLVSFEPVGDDWRRRHDAVCHVDATAIHATRPGRPLREIFDDIVAAYGAVGFANEWRHHHQGGSTGYQPRDVIAGPATEARVQEHQLFAWNPTIAGSKSEDTILATADGFRCITASGPGWPVVASEVHGQVVHRPDVLALA
jgi:antitoxin VapB